MMYLVPAYGRSYETVEAIHEAWKDGKDFRIMFSHNAAGPYCSVRDAGQMALDLCIGSIDVISVDSKGRIVQTVFSL